MDAERRETINRIKKFITINRRDFKKMFPNRSREAGDIEIRKVLVDLPDPYVVGHPCRDVGCLEVDVDQAFAELDEKRWLTAGNIVAATGFTLAGLMGIAMISDARSMGGLDGRAGETKRVQNFITYWRSLPSNQRAFPSQGLRTQFATFYNALSNDERRFFDARISSGMIKKDWSVRGPGRRRYAKYKPRRVIGAAGNR